MLRAARQTNRTIIAQAFHTAGSATIGIVVVADLSWR